MSGLVCPPWLSLKNAYNLIIGILDSADYVEFIEFNVKFKKIITQDIPHLQQPAPWWSISKLK